MQAPESRWLIARDALGCHSCERLIGAGEVFRVVTSGQYPWCAACVKRRLDLDAPDEVEPPTADVSVQAQMFRITRRIIDKELGKYRKNIHEREIGEEG